MPKELLYIPGFPKGSYGNASANDLPDGYAAYTENVDPKFRDRLAPARKSTAMNNGGGADNPTEFDAEVMAFTDFDGPQIWGWKASTRSLRYYNLATNAITLPSGFITPANHVLQSITNINRELYLPLRDDSSAEAPAGVAYWAGLPSAGQFGVAAPAYVMEPARCNPYYYAGVTRFPSAACLFNYVSATPANSRVSNSTTSDIFACITPPDETDFSGVDEDGFFEKGTTYYWAISFVYDGYQESPLLKYAVMTNGASSGPYWFSAGAGRGTNNYSSVKIRIWIDKGATLSQRITGVNLYRAQAPGTLVGGRWDVNATGYQPATKYRFVQSFSIRTGSLSSQLAQSAGVASTQAGVLFPYNDNGASTSYHTYTQNSGDLYKIEFTDQGFEGATYDENTGVFDTLEQNWVDYKLSTFVNGYHFVSQCANVPTVLGSRANNVMFRSAPGSPAVFNIAKDFLTLPETPTAMVGWNGRLFVFTETMFMRVNPEGLFIEEEYQGFGAAGNQSTYVGISKLVTATPYGIFFADLNNVYLFNGQNVVTVGDPITRNAYLGNLGWVGSSVARRRAALMAFDPTSQRVVIFFKSHDTGDHQQYYLSYDPVLGRWDYGKPSGSPWTSGFAKAAVIDSQNRFFVSLSSTNGITDTADVIHTMFTGADETILLVTPAYDFGSLKQNKFFYEVTVKNAGPGAVAPACDYRTEETGSWSALSLSGSSPIWSGLFSPKLDARILQLRVQITASGGSSGQNSIDDLSFRYRKRIMER